MLELLLCSLLTVFPDYLYRRYVQGKRLGKEITLYSVWFELRWGIVACLMLTVGLITVIFYNHPSTTNVTLFFRSVPIVPETIGRVAEVHVGFSDQVAAGSPIFRLDSTKQEAEVETARRKIAEIEAGLVVARTDILAADGKIQEANGAYQQALDELETKQELYRRNPGLVARRDIEKLEVAAEGRRGAVAAAAAAKSAAEARVSSLLPAEKASAEAALAQAEVDLSKTVIRAGVGGRVEQFGLRVGDIVNPMMRPAGILIPEGAGRRSLSGRLRADRSAGHEGRNGGRGHVHLEAMDGHPDGGHAGAGLHRRRPVPRRRATDRCAAGDPAGNHPGFPRASLRGRARGRDARQQLHRQRLFQQSRADRRRDYRRDAAPCSSRGGRCRRRPRHDLTDSGPGAADQDTCVQWALTRSASVAASPAPETRSRQYVPQDRQPEHRDCRYVPNHHPVGHHRLPRH